MQKNKNSACGKSIIMLRLNLVIEAEAEKIIVEDEEVLHGAAILKYLVQICAMTNQIFCTNSYFASVSFTNLLNAIELRCVAVVTTDTQM